jgi:enamine deaminase RidA (YjgF/YER057c/UK114 family)
MARSFVPFETLWEMAIDTPYSFMVRDDNLAWSCGQLALDKKSQVIGANNIEKQSYVVCDYILEILSRAGMHIQSVTKLLLYYVENGENNRQKMLNIFQEKFGNNILLVPIRVPHFYYDGILLEVDIYCNTEKKQYLLHNQNGVSINAISTSSEISMFVVAKANSIEFLIAELTSFLSDLSVNLEAVLSEHWFVPSGDLLAFKNCMTNDRRNFDLGAVISSGKDTDNISGHFILTREGAVISAKMIDAENSVSLLVRQTDDMTWLQARSLDVTKGTVAQTASIMESIQTTIKPLNLSFKDVVKSTTHYVGGDTAEELHQNMEVRNAYYGKPGPASTGLAVFGLSGNKSRIVIDLTLLKEK